MTPFGSFLSLAAALLLAGCATSHEYRIDAVGDSGGGAEDSAAASALAAPSGFIVVGGNVLLGAPGRRLAATAAAAPLTPSLTGSVSTVYLTTGQSLIELDGGTQLLVGALGGLDSPVSLDAVSGQVVGLTSGALTPLAPGSGTGLPLVGSRGPLSSGILTPVAGPVAGVTGSIGRPATPGLGGALNPLLPVGTPAVGGIGGLCC